MGRRGPLRQRQEEEQVQETKEVSCIETVLGFSLTIRLMKPTGRVCEEIVYPVDPRWSLKLVVYPLDLTSLSNPRLNLRTRSPRLSSLTLISSRSLSPLKVERSRMYVYHSGTWE